MQDKAGRDSRLTLLLVLSIAWTAVIWGHSLMSGPVSGAESSFVVSLARPLFEALGVRDVNLMGHVVRKLAHFSEYALLGLLTGLLRARLNHVAAPRAAVVASVLWPVLAPVVDECIQRFVPGRSGQPTDVLIDLAGVLLGTLVARVAARAASARRSPAR